MILSASIYTPSSAKSIPNEAVCALAEGSTLSLNADIRGRGKLPLEAGGVAVCDIGAKGDQLASLVDVREGVGLTSGDDFVGALSCGREVVHATECVLEVERLAGLEDGE